MIHQSTSNERSPLRDNTIAGPTRPYRSVESLAEEFSRTTDSPAGKGLPSSVYSAVHIFRKTYGEESSGDNFRHSPKQLEAIEHYNSDDCFKSLPPHLQECINLLTAEGAFEKIRDTGRMRVYRRKLLSPEEVTFLNREVRAALVWQASLDHAPQNILAR